jgi:hypothetical protein
VYGASYWYQVIKLVCMAVSGAWEEGQSGSAGRCGHAGEERGGGERRAELLGVADDRDRIDRDASVAASESGRRGGDQRRRAGREGLERVALIIHPRIRDGRSDNENALDALLGAGFAGSG